MRMRVFLPTPHMKNVLDHAFIDKCVPVNSLLVTKAEVGVLLQIQARNNLLKNVSLLEDMPLLSVKNYSGVNALHLERQYKKESCEKFTVFHRQFVQHEGTPFFLKAYKFVNATHFKFEVTKARRRDEDDMMLKDVLESSVRLLEKIVGGATPWLLPCYMHQKDFVPVAGALTSL
jgi:hypothetical protein